MASQALGNKESSSKSCIKETTIPQLYAIDSMEFDLLIVTYMGIVNFEVFSCITNSSSIYQ